MFVPSPAQSAYFNWIKTGVGNAIVEAVAGSGKTTTLLEGMPYMKGKIGYFAFNANIAAETDEKIKSKFNVREGEKCHAISKTIHSYSYTHLKWAFPDEKLELQKGNYDKTFKLLDEWLLVNPGMETWLNDAKATIGKMVSMAKQRGLGALQTASDKSIWIEMCERFELGDNLPEHIDFDSVLKVAQNILLAGNLRLDMIDFDDMIYLALQRKVRFNWTFDWVLIDEAQDTNPTRRAIATLALKRGGRLVAVGDPCQAIYGFTGADNDALNQIAKQFNCTVLPLTVSYRCPRKVVEHARKWVSHIEPHADAALGSVSVLDYDKAIAEVQPQDAMLCRYNKPLVQACFKLIRSGKAAKILGRDIGEGLIAFTKKWKVVKLEALRNKLESYLGKQTLKALAKSPPDNARIDRLTDQVETMYVLIEKCLADGQDEVVHLVELVRSMFEENLSKKNVVILSSVHKAKGMEWINVFILGREEFMPSRYAKQPWQEEQENNLIYVAITRSKLNLIEVLMPVKDEKKT